MLRTARVTASPGSLVLAAALPVLFLHFGFQPAVVVTLGSATATAYLSDFALLAVVLAALVAWARGRSGALAAGRPLWLAGAAFLIWLAVEIGYGHLHSAGYATTTHAVSAAKLAEYALLAPAVPLLVQSAADLLAVLWSLTLWGAAATVVGLAQFFGAALAGPGTVGQRQPSFLGEPDFAALSVAVLLIGAVALLAQRRELPRSLAATALVGGALGLLLSGAVAGVLGLATALAVVAALLRLRGALSLRRLVAVAALGAAVAAGAFLIRARDIQNFARFVGSAPAHETRAAHVQTYSQRTLLTWIGFEIWKQHPLLGVGWQGSNEPSNFGPVLPAARRRFPNVAALAFPSPSPSRRYGVQDAWVQALADLGVVGFLLWLSLFATAGARAVRQTLRHGNPVALLCAALVATLVWLWAAANLVAGIPLDALTALAFGLAMTPAVLE
jgi:O-antigen ligase